MSTQDASPATASLLAALERGGARVADVVTRIVGTSRVDLVGLPSASAALVLARASDKSGEPMLVITADADEARRVAADLALFLSDDGNADDEGEEPGGGVLVFPSSDVSPFADVAPDRRASMERLGTLFHLAQGLPFRFLVAPAPALCRRVPPRAALASRSLLVRAEDELDRDELVRVLGEGGYLRVPVVEDPGTYAVRGSIVDVFPPHAVGGAQVARPVRIELDDWLVLSIKAYEPEDQRTLDQVESVFIHPVRESMTGAAELALARDRLRALCDSIDMPTRAAKQLLDDVESGRAILGIEGFLPAFYESLETLFDYLPARHRVVLHDPEGAARAIDQDLGSARADRDAKVAGKQPAFPLASLYLDDAAVAARLEASPLVVIHRMSTLAAADDANAIERLGAAASEDALLDVGARDQTPLVTELSTRRAGQGRDDALRPLADHAHAWLDAGFRVMLAARTRTQADRLAGLLRGYELKLAGKPDVFRASMLATRPPGALEIVIGAASGGFLLPSEALALVTEEEIFGTRAHRRREAKKGRKRSADAFVEDLRQLQPGDYVVHSDHGVGRYLGLEKKTLGLSKGEELRGFAPVSVEVLVVEYHGGDRLFLPVTRLHQIQKHSGGEAASAPKVDRLGGQTFSKTKAKAKRHVQELADELLRLYAKRAATKREPLPSAERAYAEFEATFPFDETADQARAIEDVLVDLEGPHPMDRIVCGDVGFGKTEVAVRAAFRVAMAGRQAAVLCPTTVLAQQHFQTFVGRMQPYPLRVEVLSRFVDAKAQAKVLAGLKEGSVDVVIGTHRILSKDIHFKDLGLLVVDEEQRFGVTHKERIKKLKSEVDVLTLTATPIPRTLQLAVGGMRDLSLITTPPADRRAVRTFVTRWDDHLLTEAIRRELARGGQCFFVYNRIEGLYERANRLTALVPDARIAVAHGQMGEAALEQTMTDFVAGKYDVLCATAIIESGLDIPRANTILIDRADTFGLAQLYQLRGRVGRSRERAYCYLITPPPSTLTDEARARIEALERFSELGAGFQVASLDMELRGAGDVLGVDQSGTVTAVGFDLFLRMLEEAVAELRGQPLTIDVDTELSLDTPLFLPEEYVADVGLRLSFYKRFGVAQSEAEVAELASELEDRFGPAPPAALTYVRAMSLRPGLKAMRVLGCEANPERVTLHLKEDTPLDPAKVMQKVALPRSPWKLSPDMKLVRRFEPDLAGDAIDRVQQVLEEVATMVKSTH